MCSSDLRHHGIVCEREEVIFAARRKPVCFPGALEVGRDVVVIGLRIQSGLDELFRGACGFDVGLGRIAGIVGNDAVLFCQGDLQLFARNLRFAQRDSGLSCSEFVAGGDRQRNFDDFAVVFTDDIDPLPDNGSGVEKDLLRPGRKQGFVPLFERGGFEARCQ